MHQCLLALIFFLSFQAHSQEATESVEVEAESLQVEPVEVETVKEERVEEEAEEKPIESTEGVDSESPAVAESEIVTPVPKRKMSQPKVLKAPKKVAAPKAHEVPEKISSSFGFEQRKFRIGVSLYYSFADTFESSGSLTTDGTTFSYSGEDKADGAFGLMLSLVGGENRPVGFEMGLAYEDERTLESSKLTINGVELSGTYQGSKPKVRLLSVFGNAIFNTDQSAYFLVGMNITKINLSNSDLTVSTAIGGQAGVGFRVTPNFAIEGQYRLIHAKASSAGLLSTGKSYTQEMEHLELNGVNILAKSTF